MKRKPDKPDAYNLNFQHKNPMTPKPFGPHESPHDLTCIVLSNHVLTIGYTSNDDCLRPVQDAKLPAHATGNQQQYVQITHTWFSGSSNLAGEDRNKVLVKPIQKWWQGSWQPVAPREFQKEFPYHGLARRPKTAKAQEASPQHTTVVAAPTVAPKAQTMVAAPKMEASPQQTTVVAGIAPAAATKRPRRRYR